MRNSFTQFKKLTFLFLTIILLFSVNLLNAQVSGFIFNDYNANGQKDNSSSFNETFQSGVTVTATLANGTSFSTNSDTNGAYSFTSVQIPSGTPVRIEFYTSISSSFSGTSNGTNVQFTTGGSSNINYAIVSPDDYWDNINNPDPTIMVVHHQRGTINNGTTQQNRTLLQINNSSAGPNNPTTSNEITIDTTKRPALQSETGATFAIAYHPKQERFFQSAFMKRMQAFGNKGTGGIYIMSKSSTTWDLTSSFSLNGVTPSNSTTSLDFGTVTRTTTPGTGAAQANYISINSQWSTPKGSDGRDNDAFFKVGTMSIGGMDIDRCNDILYLINIFQKRLVTIDISGTTSSLNNISSSALGALTKAYDLASLPGYPSATNGNLRPFAVKLYRDKGYIGVVNDAMTSQSINDLKGYILQFDPQNISAGFTTSLVINFNQYADADFWHPWISTWAQCGGTNSSGPIGYPQPMISDIEFNEDGSMDIGIRDRWGDQGGSFEFWPVATPSTTADHTQTVALGDVLHVCNVNGTWAIEGTSGSCLQNFTNNNNTVNNVGYGSSYGITGKEFYSDRAGDGNTEDGFGGLAKLMGKKQTISTCLDPFGQDQTPGPNYWSTSGVKWLNNTTGAKDQIVRCLGGDFNNFDKANSLGDIEFASQCPKIQVGNRIWVDLDKDGIQDSDENPLSGLTVELVGPGNDNNLGTSDDVVLATTMTDNNGNYYFSTLTNIDSRKPSSWTGVGTNDILPNYNYQIRIPLNQATITNNNYILTDGNVNSNNNDNIDSDATTLTIGTDTYGYTNFVTTTTNHNFDFGFKVSCALVLDLVGTNVKCNGGTDGSINATITGNIATPSYAWSNNGTSEDLNNIPAGIYSVTVTEGVCVTTSSITITEPSAITVACSKTDVTINGGNDGTASVAASGGIIPYTYLWSNGSTTSSISGLVAGTYGVTVTDANNCSASCSTTINEPGCNLSATASGTNVSCNGGNIGTATVTASGNIGAVTYLWANGATTQNISSLSAGTYTVTVTESANCTTSASYTVTEPSAITVTCSKTDVTTNGGNDGTASVVASGGTSPYNYLWTNGSTTSSISGLVAGTHGVTVTDANNCNASCSTTINEPGCNLSATASGTNVSCNGGNIGTATVTASGNIGAVTYLWSNGLTTQNISSLSAGTYTVTVTESANCTTSATYTVTEPSAITVTCSKTDVTTNGGNDGTASVVASGGTSPYTYLWTNGSTTSSISGLVAGTYGVTVTDSNNCSASCSTTINEPGCNLSATASGTNVSCNGGNNGTSTVTVSGNIGAVTYLWSNGGTTQNISSLSAGTYTVTVTENANCTTSATYIVTEPSAITVTCSKTDVTTNGGNDGNASVAASGGTSPYTYLWSNGSTTSSISGLVAGTYGVTVTDANNCSASCSTTVNEPGCNLSATASGTNVSCNGGNNGTSTVTVSGNIGAVTYLWSNGGTTQTISTLTAGTYTVTVTESVNCITTSSYIVTQPNKIDAGQDQNLVCNGSNAPTTANLGAAPVGQTWYVLSQPSNANATIDNSGSASNLTKVGDYIFELHSDIDANCKDSVKITVPNCVIPCPDPNCGTFSVRKL